MKNWLLHEKNITPVVKTFFDTEILEDKIFVYDNLRDKDKCMFEIMKV